MEQNRVLTISGLIMTMVIMCSLHKNGKAKRLTGLRCSLCLLLPSIYSFVKKKYRLCLQLDSIGTVANTFLDKWDDLINNIKMNIENSWNNPVSWETPSEYIEVSSHQFPSPKISGRMTGASTILRFTIVTSDLITLCTQKCVSGSRRISRSLGNSEYGWMS